MHENSRPATRIRKHRRDGRHGKNGWVGGNARYRRSKPEMGTSMGRASTSSAWK